MASSEMRGFVFALTFMVLFSTLLVTIPVGLQGEGLEGEDVTPIDPRILSGFDEKTNWTSAAYSGSPPLYVYDYSLGAAGAGNDWRSHTDNETTILTAIKVYFLGLFWLGALDPAEFEAPDGTDRGTSLDFTEIDADAENGTVTYSMTFRDSGENAGSFIVWWDDDVHALFNDSWDAGVGHVYHGVGLETTASNNALELIIGLLFLSLPDVPVLVNTLLAVPVWAAIIFVIWFLIKEVIPFV
jgi:hypothetical protein